MLWLTPVFAVALLAQQNSGLTREGQYWVERLTGAVPVEQRLRVSAMGSITVEGAARPEVVAYSLKRRAKASSEASARRLLERITVRSSTKAGWTVLEAGTGDSGLASADLELQVPRGLLETNLVTSAGAIRGAGLDGVLKAETGGGPVDVDRVAGPVTVRTGGGVVRIGKVGGRLECYSRGGAITAESLGSEATLHTGGGEIVVREAKGLVRARTPGGAIHIERALRGIQVAAGAGLISVDESGGPVVAETGTGSIKIRSASDVRCQSGSGTIQIQAVSGGLRAATGSGSIVADLAGISRFQDSTLITGMGDITVLIPSKLAVTIEATNVTPGAHRIVSDFAEILPRGQQGNARSEASGALNGGGPVLRLSATGGTIYVRHQR
ncbi:MAG TPA: hypothetical protein VF767_07055 [Bryobacteraceae bacterium]